MINEYVKLRDAAFVAYLRTGDRTLLDALCMRYGIAVPSREDAMIGGVCKAVLAIRGLPPDVYAIAQDKLAVLGMRPEIWG